MIEKFESIISQLNKRLNTIIGNGFNLDLITESSKLKIYQTHGNEVGLNRLEDGQAGEVKVYHWFDNYYLFIEIKLIGGTYIPKGKRKSENRIEQVSISISIFKKISDHITQIFRAEWDDYADSLLYHPQPHWHFTADTALAKTFEEYARLYEDSGFMAILEPKKEDFSELKKIHFAMNGQWAKQDRHTHPIEDGKEIQNWICGVLETTKRELEYASK